VQSDDEGVSFLFKSVNEERKTFSRKVVEHIKELISSGQLKSGDKLPPERELAEMMNVSRPTIREAFKILSAMGLLKIRHGNGVFVADHGERIDNLASFLFVETDTIHELFAVRKVLECETAAEAAKNGVAEFVGEILQHTQEVYRKVVREPKFADEEERQQFLSDSDQQFHLMVAEAAGNEVIVRIMNHLIDLLRASRMQSMKIPGRVERSLTEHIRIAEALVAGDAQLARERMFEHLGSVEQTLLREIGEIEA
jgi:GntR family transcriptional repressor for pyruvate dehydrogenase complex